MKIYQAKGMKYILAFIFFTPFVIAAQNSNQYADALTAKYEQDLLKATLLLKPPFLTIKNLGENGRIIEFDGFGDNGFPEFKTTCSNIGLAATINTNQVWPSGVLGLSLTGNGSTKLGIWDSGKLRITHQEFVGRVTNMDSSTSFSAHSNNVAGLLMAAGIVPSAKGLAFQSNLKAWNFTNDRAEMALAANGLLVSNHSYANSAAWIFSGGFQYWLGDTTLNATKDWKFGFYDTRTKDFDSISWANPNYLIVKAVGNDRGNSMPAGTPHWIWNGSAYVLTTANRDTVGPYDCIVTYGTAKNILTVGAVDILPNGFVSAPINTISFSSWGPTDDGRIKPDIVCGTNSTSTPTSTHDSAYSSQGGTSMAAPGATGSLLLVQQHFYNLKSRYMKAATLKGLAIHTATNCKTTLGPNYESGWGLLNTAKAVQTISDSVKNIIKEYNLLNNDTFKFVISVNGIDTVKTTLCWTDPPAIVGVPAYNDTTPKLINDLDIRIVRNSNSQVYLPYILNPNNPSAAANTGNNFRDNVEQIYLPNLPSGTYTIVVTHKNNLQNNAPQAFSLIGSGFVLTATLPVKWMNFEGKNLGDKVQLNWRTVSEINNAGFDIERSTNNQNFDKIGFIKGFGNSLVIQKYDFVDELIKLNNIDPFSDKLYYRLKQIDFDGNYHFSKTISIDAPSMFGVNIFPNPFSENFTLTINSNKINQQVNVVVCDMLGRIILDKSLITNAKQFDFEISDLKTSNNGIYFAKITIGNKTITKKLLKI
ncbi:MAG: S8/S53 family peptidase [Bacteroidia bacterium]